MVGHFPVFSVGEHGPTRMMAERIAPMLPKYKVGAYICGHEHGMQFLQSPTSSFIVTGA